MAAVRGVARTSEMRHTPWGYRRSRFELVKPRPAMLRVDGGRRVRMVAVARPTRWPIKPRHIERWCSQPRCYNQRLAPIDVSLVCGARDDRLEMCPMCPMTLRKSHARVESQQLELEMDRHLRAVLVQFFGRQKKKKK